MKKARNSGLSFHHINNASRKKTEQEEKHHTKKLLTQKINKNTSGQSTAGALFWGNDLCFLKVFEVKNLEIPLIPE